MKDYSIFLLFLVFIVFSCGKDDTDNPSTNVNCSLYQKVYIDDLCKFYSQPGIIGNDIYQGECINLVGTVSFIDDGLNEITMNLNDFRSGECGGEKVWIDFPNSFRNDLAGYQVGDIISIKGKFDREERPVGEPRRRLIPHSVQPMLSTTDNDCGFVGKFWDCASQDCESWSYVFRPSAQGNILHTTANPSSLNPYKDPKYHYLVSATCDSIYLTDIETTVNKIWLIEFISRDSLVLINENNQEVRLFDD